MKKSPANPHRIADALAFGARLWSGANIRILGENPHLLNDSAPQQRVYVANHSSHLDFIVLWAALPASLRRVTRPVAARDYWEKTALRRYLAVRVYRAILIDRDHLSVHHNPIRQIADEMGDDSLILFPEGTRGDGSEIGPFKSGVFRLAQRAPELPYIPVYIENLNRILPKGEILPLPLLTSISIGDPLRLLPGENKDAFLTRLRDAVVALQTAHQ